MNLEGISLQILPWVTALFLKIVFFLVEQTHIEVNYFLIQIIRFKTTAVKGTRVSNLCSYHYDLLVMLYLAQCSLDRKRFPALLSFKPGRRKVFQRTKSGHGYDYQRTFRDFN